MRKYLAVLIAVLGLAFVVARQDQYAADQTAQKAAELHETAVPAKPDEQHPQKNVPNPAGNSPRWYLLCLYSLFRWPNGTETWAIILTLMAIAEQTGQNRKATRVMQDQSNHMASQTIVLAESQKAAKQSAEAALLNAQAVIASERPFIKVEVEASKDGQSFQIMANNCGKTPAEIRIDGSQWAFFDNENGPPSPPTYYIDELISIYRKIVAPGDAPFATGDPLMVSSMRQGGPQLMQEVDRCQKFLFFWGKIVYIGALGKERKGIIPYETRWCFRYIPSATKPILIRDGAMGYNEHT